MIGHLLPSIGNSCAVLANLCSVASATQLPTNPHATTTLTLRQKPGGSWTQTGFSCAAETAAPQLTALLVRQEIEKLVPHPDVGVAPPGGTTLVNIQTLLWVNTPAEQPLGTVTLLGHHVQLRVHVAHIDWNFGDGHTDTTTSPEPRYTPTHTCHTATCPGYWGHIYTSTGTDSITASVTWTGRYRVDRGPWQDITDTVTGPAATTTLTIRQARGILVPDQPTH